MANMCRLSSQEILGPTILITKTFSIILSALVDANYKFIYVDVGSNGKISDGGVFRNSSLAAALDENFLGLPGPPLIKDSETLLPYVIVHQETKGNDEKKGHFET